MFFYLILKVLKNLPAGLFGYHQLFELSSQLVPDPVKWRADIDFISGLIGHIPGTDGEVKILDQKQKIRNELDPFSDTFRGSRISECRRSERRNFGSIGVPSEIIEFIYFFFFYAKFFNIVYPVRYSTSTCLAQTRTMLHFIKSSLLSR